MKTFETIRDVVDNAIELHRQAASTYRRIDRESSDPRAGMLLDYMIRHHDYMEGNVSKVKEGAEAAALDTYIQYTLEEPPTLFFENLLKEHSRRDLDGLCAMGQAVYEYLVSLFEEALREMDSTTSAGDFVKELMDLEALERRKLTQTLGDLLDM